MKGDTGEKEVFKVYCSFYGLDHPSRMVRDACVYLERMAGIVTAEVNITLYIWSSGTCVSLGHNTNALQAFSRFVAERKKFGTRKNGETTTACEKTGGNYVWQAGENVCEETY